MKRKTVTKKAKDTKDLTARLGPVRKVTKSEKAKGTKGAVVLHLECGHTRTATPRKTMRCRKCRPGAKKAA